MVTKRTYTCTVEHAETGLTFQVYCIDLFCEAHDTLGVPSFVFEDRFYETATCQKVIRDPKNRKGIWIVVTDKGNWYTHETISSILP